MSTSSTTAPASSSPAATPPLAATASPAAAAPAFTPYQKVIVAILAFLQFTIVLDFMILSPLGALLMRDLHISASRFGLVVSAYAFSAGVSGFLAAGFADRFDRKKMLMFFYAGFLVGTLLCGIAPTYHFLLFARMVTGLFGGVIGSISFAIITDLFPFNQRGRVMGVVQTSFAASQVLGLPLGLYLSSVWGWHAPFLMIVSFSTVAGVLIGIYMKPIVGHLKLQRPEGGALGHLVKTVSRARYLRAFATTTFLVTGGFMLMPFGSAFTVNNIGIPIEKLTIVYLFTGICAVFAGPIAGKLSDSLGKFRLFCAGSAIAVVMIYIYTHLGVTPLPMVILVNAVLFIGITSRMISASALMSAVPDAADRGAFMSVNSSLQSTAGGVAAAVAGLIVVKTESGALQRYDTLGWVVITSIAVTVVLLYFIDRMVKGDGPQKAPLPAGPSE